MRVTSVGQTFYLPPMPDPKKVHEGIMEIIHLVLAQELNDKNKRLDEKEVS